MPEKTWGRAQRIILGVCLVLAAAMFALSRSETLVESVYAERIFPVLVRIVAFVSSWLPVSLMETGLVLLLVFVGLHLFVVGRGRSKPSRGGWWYASSSLVILVVFLTAGYLLWGLNYARAPLAERLGWKAPNTSEESQERSLAELEKLARHLVKSTNQAYQACEEVAAWDRFASAQDSWAVLDRTIEAGLSRAGEALNVATPLPVANTRAKPLAVSDLMNYLGLSGIYSPWTAEPGFNRHLPAVELPHTIAHEKAHASGFASEDEANFIGFLACIFSPDPVARYSGYLFGQRQLLAELRKRSRQRYDNVRTLRLPEVERDLQAIRKFWERYESPATEVAGQVNDQYLRFQGVTGGIESYRLSARLILLFNRAEIEWPPAGER